MPVQSFCWYKASCFTQQSSEDRLLPTRWSQSSVMFEPFYLSVLPDIPVRLLPLLTNLPPQPFEVTSSSLCSWTSGFCALLYALPRARKIFIPVKSLLILLGPAHVSVTTDPHDSTDHVKVASFFLPLRMEALKNDGPTYTWAEALCEKAQGPWEISDMTLV